MHFTSSKKKEIFNQKRRITQKWWLSQDFSTDYIDELAVKINLSPIEKISCFFFFHLFIKNQFPTSTLSRCCSSRTLPHHWRDNKIGVLRSPQFLMTKAIHKGDQPYPIIRLRFLNPRRVPSERANMSDENEVFRFEHQNQNKKAYKMKFFLATRCLFYLHFTKILKSRRPLSSLDYPIFLSLSCGSLFSQFLTCCGDCVCMPIFWHLATPLTSQLCSPEGISSNFASVLTLALCRHSCFTCSELCWLSWWASRMAHQSGEAAYERRALLIQIPPNFSVFLVYWKNQKKNV